MSKSLNVHLHLVYNVATWSYIEEKREKFKTTELTSHLSTTYAVLTQAQSRIWKARKNMFFHFDVWKIVSVEVKGLCLKEKLFQVIFQGLWKYCNDSLFFLIIKIFFISRGGAQVCYNQQICVFRRKQRFNCQKYWLNFRRRIMQLLFAHNLYSSDMSFRVKFRKILRNKHSVFVPNEAIFYPGKKFDSGQILITC